MNKFILELKEPAWRRYLRWSLWTLIVVFCVALVWVGSTTAMHMVRDYQLTQSAKRLSVLNPQLGVMLAEDFYSKNATQTNHLLYIKAAIDASAWELADALLEEYRTRKSPWSLLAAAYEVQVIAQVAPETLQEAAERLLKFQPENDLEKLTFGQAAVVSQNEKIQEAAMRPLAQLMRTPLRNDSAIIRTQLSIATDKPKEAKERILSLIDTQLPPTHSITLLGLLKEMDLPEYEDYLSSLRLRMRGDTLMAVGLIDFAWENNIAPQEIFNWIKTLRANVSTDIQIQIRKIALLQLAKQTNKALELAQMIPNSVFQEAITALLEGRSPSYYKIQANEDWVNLLVYAQLLGNTTIELNVARALSEGNASSAWAAQAYLQSAIKTNQTKSIALAYRQLTHRIADSKILTIASSYWELITKTTEDKKAVYKALREAAEQYEERTQTRISKTFAYFALGSTTDALLALDEHSIDNRERFLRAYVTSQSGQGRAATRMFARVDIDALTSVEQDLMKATVAKIKEESSVQKILDILQPTQSPASQTKETSEEVSK